MAQWKAILLGEIKWKCNINSSALFIFKENVCTYRYRDIVQIIIPKALKIMPPFVHDKLAYIWHKFTDYSLNRCAIK